MSKYTWAAMYISLVSVSKVKRLLLQRDQDEKIQNTKMKNFNV